MSNNEINELKKALTKATQRAEAAEAKVNSLTSQASSNATLDDIVQLADAAYQHFNAAALHVGADPTQVDPGAYVPQVRPHYAFRHAFTQILDGLHKAVHGFSYGKGGERNSQQRKMQGLVDSIERSKDYMETLRTRGDLVILVEGQKPRLTEAGKRQYDQIVECDLLIKKLEALAEVFEEAHHMVSPEEPYMPMDDRIAAAKEKREKQAEAAKALPGLFAQMGLDTSVFGRGADA